MQPRNTRAGVVTRTPRATTVDRSSATPGARSCWNVSPRAGCAGMKRPGLAPRQPAALELVVLHDRHGEPGHARRGRQAAHPAAEADPAAALPVALAAAHAG